MARIPVYEQRTRAAGPVATFARQIDVSSGLNAIAGAVNDAENSALRIMEQKKQEAKRKQDETDRADATSRLSQARIDAEQLKQTVSQKVPANGSGYRETLKSEFEKYRAKSLEGVTSPGSKAYLTEGFTRLATDLELEAMEYETKLGFKAKEKAYDSAKENTKKYVSAYPDKLPTALAELLAPMDGAVEPEALKSERKRLYTREVANSAAEAIARKDPYGTVKTLSKPDKEGRYGKLAFDALQQEDIDRVRSMAETEIRQREAEARQRQILARSDLDARVRDVTAASLAGAPLTMPMPTKAEFVAAYGKDGAERYDKQFLPTIKIGGEVQALAQATPAERADILKRNAPTETSGFADAQERYNLLLKADGQIQQMRQKDPAAYAIQYDPATKAAFAAYAATANDPMATPQAQATAAQGYMRQQLAAQERLGLSGPVLPQSTKDALVGQFFNQEQGGEKAAQTIAAERQKWGPYWNKVWSAIAPDLPGAASVVGEMEPSAAGRLAEVSAIKLDELAKTIPTNITQKDISDSVRDSLDDYIGSVYGQPGADTRMAAIADASQRLAMRYVAGGKSLNAAVDQATAETINSRYEFVTVGDGTVRVPRNQTVTDSAVASSLRALTRVERDKLNTPFFDETTWATTADDSGVALMWSGRVVERADGTPVIYTWDQLENRKATMREDARQLDAEMRGFNP